MLRMATDDFEQSSEAPEKIGYDAFICHASEDKEIIVRPLANILVEKGFDIWFDEFELTVGDKLRESIDKGLINSRYGIVVLSPSFFKREWSKRELDGLTALEIEGKSLILPIWHDIGMDDLLDYSPPSANIIALKTAEMTINEIAEKLSDVLYL